MNTGELLDLWQLGLGRTAVEQGLQLASRVCSTSERDSVGLRNDRILQWRKKVFGAQVSAVSTCPLCSTLVEVGFSTDSLPIAEGGGIHKFATAGLEFSFRLPNSLDLAYLLRFTDEEEAERALLGRCVLGVRRGKRTVAIGKVPTAAIDALCERMEELDPSAAQRVRLECPNCSHQWVSLFDVTSFVWRELSGLARRSLREIHDLACSYGWTEGEILALSPGRRHMYLEMVRA